MVLEKIKEIISTQFDIETESLSEDTNFLTDLGADSLDVVELTMNVEDAFDIPEVSEETIRGIQTIRDLVEYVISVTE
ncbi:MAG: acyl carrier protein [Ruminococcaceae bacterium]|nr:acyl carrier protein [Oscillospiraceae bacterium]